MWAEEKAVAKEVGKVVILTGRVELVTHRVGAEETIPHQRSKIRLRAEWDERDICQGDISVER